MAAERAGQAARERTGSKLGLDFITGRQKLIQGEAVVEVGWTLDVGHWWRLWTLDGLGQQGSDVQTAAQVPGQVPEILHIVLRTRLVLFTV